MLDAHRMFHVGVLVTDLDVAMRDLGSGGLTWAEPRTIDEMPVWTPETGSRMVPLRFVYSCAGPQHVELLESPGDSPWNAGDQAGIHHVGYWADDVAEKVESAIELGWSLRLANAAPGEGYGLFAYVQTPSGLLVEFVADEIRSSFEDWWNATDG